MLSTGSDSVPHVPTLEWFVLCKTAATNNVTFIYNRKPTYRSYWLVTTTQSIIDYKFTFNFLSIISVSILPFFLCQFFWTFSLSLNSEKIHRKEQNIVIKCDWHFPPQSTLTTMSNAKPDATCGYTQKNRPPSYKTNPKSSCFMTNSQLIHIFSLSKPQICKQLLITSTSPNKQQPKLTRNPPNFL